MNGCTVSPTVDLTLPKMVNSSSGPEDAIIVLDEEEAKGNEDSELIEELAIKIDNVRSASGEEVSILDDGEHVRSGDIEEVAILEDDGKINSDVARSEYIEETEVLDDGRPIHVENVRSECMVEAEVIEDDSGGINVENVRSECMEEAEVIEDDERLNVENVRTESMEDAEVIEDDERINVENVRSECVEEKDDLGGHDKRNAENVGMECIEEADAVEDDIKLSVENVRSEYSEEITILDDCEKNDMENERPEVSSDVAIIEDSEKLHVDNVRTEHDEDVAIIEDSVKFQVDNVRTEHNEGVAVAYNSGGKLDSRRSLCSDDRTMTEECSKINVGNVRSVIDEDVAIIVDNEEVQHQASEIDSAKNKRTVVTDKGNIFEKLKADLERTENEKIDNDVIFLSNDSVCGDEDENDVGAGGDGYHQAVVPGNEKKDVVDQRNDVAEDITMLDDSETNDIKTEDSIQKEVVNDVTMIKNGDLDNKSGNNDSESKIESMVVEPQAEADADEVAPDVQSGSDSNASPAGASERESPDDLQRLKSQNNNDHEIHSPANVKSNGVVDDDVKPAIDDVTVDNDVTMANDDEELKSEDGVALGTISEDNSKDKQIMTESVDEDIVEESNGESYNDSQESMPSQGVSDKIAENKAEDALLSEDIDLPRSRSSSVGSVASDILLESPVASPKPSTSGILGVDATSRKRPMSRSSACSEESSLKKSRLSDSESQVQDESDQKSDSKSQSGSESGELLTVLSDEMLHGLIGQKLTSLLTRELEQVVAPLRKKISELQNTSEWWKDKAVTLQKQINDLDLIQQRTEHKRGVVSKPAMRTVAIQVCTTSSVKNQLIARQITPVQNQTNNPPFNLLHHTTTSPAKQTAPNVVGTPIRNPSMTTMTNTTFRIAPNPAVNKAPNLSTHVHNPRVQSPREQNSVVNRSSGLQAFVISPPTTQSSHVRYPNKLNTVREMLSHRTTSSQGGPTPVSNLVSNVKPATIQLPGGNRVVIDLTSDEEKKRNKLNGIVQGMVVPSNTQTNAVNTQPIIIGGNNVPMLLQAYNSAQSNQNILLTQGNSSNVIISGLVPKSVGGSSASLPTTGTYTLQKMSMAPSSGPRPVSLQRGGAVNNTVNPTKFSTIRVRLPTSQVTSLVTQKPSLSTPTHPAPLPARPAGTQKHPSSKREPPQPTLKISRVPQGIVLSWNMILSPEYEDISNYQLFAYQEGSQLPCTSLWKRVGDVKALPLPMACTLTQFQEGNKYHFAVRAVDKCGRIGFFSLPATIHLLNKIKN